MKFEIRQLSSKEDEKRFKEVAKLFSDLYDHMKEKGFMREAAPKAGKLWIETIKPSLGKLHVIFVAEYENEIIGFISGNIRLMPNYLRNSKVGYCSHIYIKPDFRGQKIGKKLSQKLQDWFKKQNVDYIELEVIDKSALSFWQKNNFSVDATRMIKQVENEEV